MCKKESHISLHNCAIQFVHYRYYKAHEMSKAKFANSVDPNKGPGPSCSKHRQLNELVKRSTR